MTTTLIVRDATFAINGAPEQRGEPRAHLATRISEVSAMEERTAEECIEVLSSVAGGEGADPEVLEALVVVGLAKRQLAERLSLPTIETGCRLATRLERGSEIEHARAVLDALAHAFPNEESLERERAQLLSRQGTVQDLVGRYFERARKLMREGRNREAAGWLREVLQLDPRRKDAKRLLRDLRFKTHGRPKRQVGGAMRSMFVLLLVGLGVAYAALREKRLAQEYGALPAGVSGNLPSLQKRLVEVERFVREHPAWHGALGALSERSTLRVQVSVLEEQVRHEQALAERAEAERLESADLLRQRGLICAQSGDLRGALEAFREALERGGAGWSQYDRVSRDAADLEAALNTQQ